MFTAMPDSGNGASLENFRSGSTPNVCLLVIVCLNIALRTASPVTLSAPPSLAAASIERSVNSIWFMPIKVITSQPPVSLYFATSMS